FRFAYFRDDMESTVHSPTISGLLQPGQLFRDLFVGEHYKKNDNNYVAPFWLDVLNPTEEEMKVISKAFGIHPLTAEDIFLGEAREKVELFKDYYLVCFRSFDIVAERTKPLNVYILVFRTGVLTFHFAPTPHPINVRRRARLIRDYMDVSSDWIAYALIDDITDAFAPIIEIIEDEVYDIEEAILKMHSDMLRRIAECRKRVMSVSRLLGSKADVIKSFAKRCNEDWEVAPRSDIGMYLGDIQDHIVTMVSSLNHFEKLLSRSHSNYLAQINIDMTKVNNDMNDVLSKITILGTAVLPLNVITGLWGMNCVVPGQAYNNLGWFFGIVGFMTIFAGWSVWFTKKKLNF
ncbi:Mg2+ transporter protein, partial [Hanseniaspora valbyensis NRRL Y-1626]